MGIQDCTFLRIAHGTSAIGLQNTLYPTGTGTQVIEELEVG